MAGRTKAVSVLQSTQATLMTKLSHPKRDLIIITSTIPCYPMAKASSSVSCSDASHHRPTAIGGQVCKAGLPKNILAQPEVTVVVPLTPPHWERKNLLMKSSILTCWDDITSYGSVLKSAVPVPMLSQHECLNIP